MTKGYIEVVKKEIIAYFKEHEEVFNECIEELDDYCGYLEHNRRIPMEDFDDYMGAVEPTTIARMIFYGFDYDCDGQFYPDREYFFLNGMGNLCSTDYKDYSCYLNEYAVERMLERMLEYREEIYTIEADEELSALFNELVAAEEEMAAESGRIA